MGEVYRAEDTVLDRHFAIEFPPDNFAGDARRLARFEREVKLIASLNHPNIASIYGPEQAYGKPSRRMTAKSRYGKLRLAAPGRVVAKPEKWLAIGKLD